MAPSLEKALQAWRNGNPTHALELCSTAVERNADATDAYRLAAEIHGSAGNVDGAIAACQEVAKLAPGDAGNLRRMAVFLTQRRMPEAAAVVLEKSLELEPDNVRALNNLGSLFNELGRVEAAIVVLRKALVLRADYAVASINLGIALSKVGRLDEAIAAYRQAALLNTKDPRLLTQLGHLMRKLGFSIDALAAFDAALESLPGDISAQEGRVLAVMALNRYEDAVSAIAALRAAAPWNHYLQGHQLHAELQCAAWNDFQTSSSDIALRVRRGERVDLPWSFMAHNESPADQLACARIFMTDQIAPNAVGVERSTRLSKGRVRVAYLSADFRDHPVSQLLAGVIEAHDRGRFETYAFATGADDGSEMHRRVVAAFDHFEPVGALKDRDIAERIAAHSIDIVVDLGGHTSESRTPLLAYRPAPLQMSFLGFPGTTGADFIDYIIADRHVIPEADQPHYSEKVIYLPDSYLPGALPGMSQSVDRIGAGLPAAGVVYCSFNAPYKILPAVFDVWMRTLTAVPESVLWLRDAAGVVKRNFAREARSRGVDPARLIFAPKVATLAQHVARLGAADLFLDTRPYNAHTGASDALAAGVPVLTMRGGSFASRVATSLLFACGLGDLSTDGLRAYEERAVNLGHSPQALARLKAHLLQVRSTAPLFDSVRFCRNLEAAYLEIWARHGRGEPPSSLSIG